MGYGEEEEERKEAEEKEEEYPPPEIEGEEGEQHPWVGREERHGKKGQTSQVDKGEDLQKDRKKDAAAGENPAEGQ